MNFRPAVTSLSLLSVTRGQFASGAALVFAAASLAIGCRSTGASGARKSSKRSTLYGYVYKVSGRDTVPAIKAEVWTDPSSDKVLTDSVGYWEIIDGIVDNRYRVKAKGDGINGASPQIDIKTGTNVKVIVLLGVEETAWPPSVNLDNKAVTKREGPSKVRCCEP